MTTKQKVLVVEDEEPILNGLLDLLVFNGYSADGAADGQEGLSKATEGSYHLIILDVMLPKMDGFSVCQKIREFDKQVPIIMLTAKSEEDDIVNGLKLGADDYIPKPFSIKVLMSRVESLLRRSGLSRKTDRYLMLGDSVKIDTENLLATHLLGLDRNEELTGLELDLLLYFQQHLGRAVSRDELLVEVWGYKSGSTIETRTVDIHVAKLRKKLETNPKNPKFLTTVRGKGYMLEHSSYA